jgi:hypothetical protein
LSPLPNAVVIGAQKCGTSALHYYLDLHPEISMSHPASLNFFIDDADNEALDEQWQPMLPPTWSKGVDWYSAQFSARAPVRGEVSPSYTAPWYPGVAERMAAVIPDVRLIFNVRDPVDRTIAHYLHMRSAGRESRDMADALADPESRYIARSRYHAALEPFVARFPASRILVVDQADLLARRRRTLEEVYAFLGVDPGFWSEKLERHRHLTVAKARRHALLTRLMRMPGLRFAYRLPQEVKWHVERLFTLRDPGPGQPVVDEQLRAKLVAELRDDAARFREMTEKGFAGWSL